MARRTFDVVDVAKGGSVPMPVYVPPMPDAVLNEKLTLPSVMSLVVPSSAGTSSAPTVMPNPPYPHDILNIPLTTLSTFDPSGISERAAYPHALSAIVEIIPA